MSIFSKTISIKKQYFILPIVLISLILGIWTGWQRIGWDLPLANYSGVHGSFMVGSFLGTLICLERTVTYRNKKFLLLPFVCSLSFLFFMIQQPKISYWILLLSGIGLGYIYFKLYLQFNEIYLLIMLCGALCWSIGNGILIKTSFYPQAVTWWIAFLFFTITAERIELSRYLQLSVTRKVILLILLAVFIIGIFVPFHDIGGYIIAFSFIGTSVWLLVNDMASRSIIKEGQHRYSGILLLTGYVWLAVSGFFMAYGSYWGLLYDPTLHTFFLGFVFSMIFAHAPIILPGVLGLPIKPFNKYLYFWFYLLQISLIMRMTCIITADLNLKQIGGLLNGIAILGFFVNIIYLTVKKEFLIKTNKI